MAPSFDPQVNDLALFFANGKEIGKRWIPYELYSNDETRIDDAQLPAGWDASIVAEQSGDSGHYYVANLGRLLPPGALIEEKRADQSLRERARAGAIKSRQAAKDNKIVFKNGDLVIVPWTPDGNGKPHLISRETYMEHCPPIEDPGSSDLTYMAANEGVVLANMPRPVDLKGFTCYLLSLLALRSGALGFTDGGDKLDVREKMVARSRTKP